MCAGGGGVDGAINSGLRRFLNSKVGTMWRVGRFEIDCGLELANGFSRS